MDALNAQKGPEVIVGDIVVLEVVRGVRGARDAATVLRGFKARGITPFLSPDLAIEAAHNDRRLRSIGITVNKMADLIIATFCIANGHSLLHEDRDYDHFAKHLGLRVASA